VSAPGVDEGRVTPWIAEAVPGLQPPFTFERVGHGASNLTYRVTGTDGRSVVLRRPPLGVLLESAHDMGREHRILTALAPTAVPVPQPLALCTDAEVTGAPFYLMEHCQGHVIADRSRADVLGEDARRTASLSLVRVMADLHALDVEEIGLGELGRHDGYAARQLKRWARQWEGSKSEEIPAIERVAEALAGSLPEQRDVSVVHGDYRLDNVIVGDDGTVRAVLDWELCTLGDPIADLGLLMVYWAEPGEEPALREPATQLPGFPTRQEIVDAYAEASGYDLSTLGFYRTLGYWKLAVIVQGVYRRWTDNPANAASSAADSYRDGVFRLAEAAEAAAGEAGLL
jgi:aminoglycoside phosphotransferase (APT) family kinase protein